MASLRVAPHPLDYAKADYAYIERANPALLKLFQAHVLAVREAPSVLDIGAGAGANVRAVKRLAPAAHITGVEPNARARALLSDVCDVTVAGDGESWLDTASAERFDALFLSDVVEHMEKPVRFLSALAADVRTRSALFLVSVPNYAVWYNRLGTLAGHFEYQASGLFDRTHLRFFTKGSVRRLLEYVGLEVLEQRATPSLVQSLAPWLRRAFERSAEAGEHLALERSRLYGTYQRWVEPAESRLCELWPALLGFQIVSAARVRRAAP